MLYMYSGYYFDSTYVLIILGLLLTLGASLYVKASFAKYKNVRNYSGLTGAAAAERLLHNAGIYDVRIEHISGDLTDNYDPRNKVLHLSDSVINSTSVAAIGVAAHECGHAIQHAKAFAPLKLRSAMVPTVNICSTASWPLILAGIFLGYSRTLIFLGILAFAVAVLFSIVTLPVEFDASHRALKILGTTGMLRDQELRQAKSVLTAAALTYVAAAVSMILQLLRLLILFGGDRRK